jgi:hypothetical protein
MIFIPLRKHIYEPPKPVMGIALILHITQYDVRFVTLAVVVRKSSIYYDKKPCSPLKFSRNFEGICHLHVHGAKKQ